jgi:hypothetical protein
MDGIIPILFKLFHKRERERTLPCSLCKTSIIQIPKWRRTFPKEKYRPIL